MNAVERASEDDVETTYRRKRRTGRIVIASFLALIVVVEVLTFVGRARTAQSDAKPHSFYGIAGSHGPDYVTVAAYILEISPVAGTMQVRVTIDPHGSYALPDGHWPEVSTLTLTGTPEVPSRWRQVRSRRQSNSHSPSTAI